MSSLNYPTEISGNCPLSIAHSRSSLTSRESQFIRTVSAYTSLLQHQPNIPELYIRRCIETFSYCCKLSQSKSLRLNKRNISVGSTYFTMKTFINPTIREIGIIFNIPEKMVIRSIKAFRITYMNDNNLRSIFENEEGQSNLYRYAGVLGLGWDAIRASTKIIGCENKKMTSDTDVIYSLAKHLDTKNTTTSIIKTSKKLRNALKGCQTTIFPTLNTP